MPEDPEPTGDERELFLRWLVYLRESLLTRLDDIDEAQARWTPDGKLIQLLGIVNHLAHVERRWTDGVYLGGAFSRSEEEFRVPVGRTIAEVVADYRAAAANTEAVVRARLRRTISAAATRIPVSTCAGCSSTWSKRRHAMPDMPTRRVNSSTGRPGTEWRAPRSRGARRRSGPSSRTCPRRRGGEPPFGLSSSPTRSRSGLASPRPTRLLGKTWDWVLEVSALELETRFAYRIVEGVAKMTVEYQLEATDSGCRFTMSAESDGDGTLARLLKPIAARTLRRESERHVANLKRLLESPE